MWMASAKGGAGWEAVEAVSSQEGFPEHAKR